MLPFFVYAELNLYISAMCICMLNNKDELEIFKASERMEFYKVLAKGNDGKFSTPWREEPVRLGRWYVEYEAKYTYYRKYEVKDPNSILYHENFANNWLYDKGLSIVPYVGEGVIHLFVNKEDAEDFALNRPCTCEGELVVVKAIVPKGTRYIKGMYFQDDHAYESVGVKCVKYRDLNDEGWFKNVLKKFKKQK